MARERTKELLSDAETRVKTRHKKIVDGGSSDDITIIARHFVNFI